MNTKITKRALIKSSLAAATLVLLFLSNSNIIKAESITGNQLTSEKTKDQLQQINNINLDNNAKSSLENQISINSESTKTGETSIQTQGEPTIVKSGKWGENGAKWEYDSNNCLKIKGGTIKGEDENKGAFADQDILKSVEKIEFEQPLKLEGAFQYWFRYVKDNRLTKFTEVSGLDNIDTSKVTNMRGMFYASKITSLDLSTWDTSSVTDMSYMFTDMFSDGNDGLLNVGGKFAANSKNVKDMTYMFNGCAGLSKIKGIANLNTSSVISMENMFHGDYNLTELDLSHFNTENVTNMQDMLSYLVSLDYLDLSSFDTSKTTSMTNMLANDVAVMIAIIENGKVVPKPVSGITTLVLGSKTKLKQETALSEPDPAITPNKDNFINKWRLFGNDGEPQLTTKDLLQKSQDGTLKPGAYTWKKQTTPPNNNGNSNPNIIQTPAPTDTGNQIDNNKETEKEHNNNDVVPGNSQKVTLMHNAYFYDDNGKRANGIILGIGSIVNTYGTTTIAGREFYKVVDYKNNNKQYYIVAGNVQPTVQKLKRNANIYNQYCQQVIGAGKLKKGENIKTYGAPVIMQGLSYYIISRNRLVKTKDLILKIDNNNTDEIAPANNSLLTSTQPTVKKTVKHNAYLYDENGARANELIVNAGSVVDVTGQRVINNRNYYELEDGLSIAADNIDGIHLKLKHNSYVYNQYGERKGKKILKKGSTINTYGNPIIMKNRKFYIIGKNKFVKKSNF